MPLVKDTPLTAQAKTQCVHTMQVNWASNDSLNEPEYLSNSRKRSGFKKKLKKKKPRQF